ncbi:MAG TPA: uracil-DNA glycosylase family protein [Chitinophagaceae bacterium]|nr:uracil-DNA glycosylase family protein [Chitinophagaceae bacterium]
MYLANNILSFLSNIQLPFTLPAGVEVLDVHKEAAVQNVCRQFYHKFYNDNAPRHMLLGINPGRFGGGVTGIPFTDPIRLQNDCGITNDFQKKQELSSVFIYNMITGFGGPNAFYKKFYISSISPLGFIKNGKNLNYYDDAALKKIVQPFVVDCISSQLHWGLKRGVCFCIGEGENLKYLAALNEKHGWFNSVQGLPHPRFIMQYKLKQKEKYVEEYLLRLKSVS